jgi:hypothetical protein
MHLKDLCCANILKETFLSFIENVNTYKQFQQDNIVGIMQSFWLLVLRLNGRAGIRVCFLSDGILLR